MTRISRERFVEILTEEIDNAVKNLAIDAPSNKKPLKNSFTVFLAGTIDADQGSVDWQHKLIDIFNKKNDNEKPVTIYNPRREDWPNNGSAEVKRQIKWEHNHMDDADLIVMNILGDSKSPISLMEIGMYAASGKLVVFCKPEFYRFDNVEMVCKKYNVPLYKTNDLNRIYNTIIDKSKK